MTATSQRAPDMGRAPPREYGEPLNGMDRRRQSQSKARAILGYPEENGGHPPAAPEVPRAPPASYRGQPGRPPPSQGADVSRSFSARAKKMPFVAPEAFADDDDIDEYDHTGQTVEDYIPESRRRDNGKTLPAAASPLVPRINTDISPRQGQPASHATTSRRTSEGSTAQRRQGSNGLPPRSSTLREPANMTEEQRREWAPDRSPLQKLEVTLNDISKEEKRARVEEAEMLLRESKSRRGGRRASRDVDHASERSTVQQMPRQEHASLEEAGLVRNLSGKHRDRLQHSAAVDVRKADVRRLSGEGRGGFDYHDQDYEARRRSGKPLTDYPQSPRDHLADEGNDSSPRYDTKLAPARRQAGGQTVPSDVKHSAANKRQPLEQTIPRALIQERQANAPQQGNRPTPGTLRPGNAPFEGNMGSRAGRRQAPDEQADSYMPPEEEESLRNESKAPRIHQPSGQGAHLLRAVPQRTLRQQTDHDYVTDGVTRSVSARQPQIHDSLGSNITRAVSLQQQGPPRVPTSDYEASARTGPIPIANSSHKAVLGEATTAATAGAVAVAARSAMGRSNSKKLQKAPPPGYNPFNPKRGRRSSLQDPQQRSDDIVDIIQAHERKPAIKEVVRSPSQRAPEAVTTEMQRSASQRAPEPVGLGLQHTSDEGPVHQKHHLSDVFHHKPRQQSVSFKEPLQGPRKLDEWKTGVVGRLTLADMNLQERGAENNKAWWEGGGGSKSRRRSGGRPKVVDDYERGYEQPSEATEFRPPLYLRCGPLLRYTGMRRERRGQVDGLGQPTQDRETWRGSVLIVTEDSQSSYAPGPTLRLFSQPMNLLPPPPAHIDGEHGVLAPEYVDPIAGLTKVSRTGRVLYVRPVDHLEEGKDLSRIETEDGLFEASSSSIDVHDQKSTNAQPNRRNRGDDGEELGKFKDIKAVRLYADPSRNVTFWRFNLEVDLGEHQAHIAYRINQGPSVGFWVPARGQSMNIMFQSCNGFSLSVNPDTFSGPDPLWRDVLNTHQTRPFHVMIGGGDQIYNDRVMVQTDIFQAWTKIKNPLEKHEYPFSTEMNDELETFYLNRYAMWFSQGLFGMAAAQIPTINIWDDHDIIDGYGSYPDRFMNTPVFTGLGAVAFKYYMLFQHHSIPEEMQADEPSWLLGASPGPYINQLSRSVFMFLGRHIAFLGLDCRTERTRDEIMTDGTYDIVFDRCRREIVEGDTKHLIVLLGVPIAYPRLVWLENVLTSNAMAPIKALGRAGMFGGFLNKFDGGVEILDDLDDHWTAAHHKGERNWLIEELQDLAAEKSVRITILGGDVHLAAIGQFYSNPRLKIKKDRDHRYMPNVISSAIVNTPPPEMMGDILNRRNKVHHLDAETEEDMIPMFTHDVDGKTRNNKRLLPRRNWCSIREYHPGSTPPPTPPSEPMTPDEPEEFLEKPKRRFSFSGGASRPGNFLRRLSQRGAPPAAMDNTTPPDMALNGNSNRPFNSGDVPPASQQEQGSYFPPVDGPFASAPLPRPGNFHRRATNLSEKAAKRGGPGAGVGLDADGEIIDDYVNLEGGLDVVLNCEVSKGDPAGITTPYRLLVPALWYDGEPDPNPMPTAKRGGFIRRLTVRKKGGSKAAGNQGRGNWGQESETEDSYTDGEDERQGQPSQPIQRTAEPQGYSGVEAYRPPGKRRWF